MGTYSIAGAGHQWYNGSVLENAPKRSSIQGSDQADLDGLTEEIVAQQSRSRPPAAAGGLAVAGERAPFLLGLEAQARPWRLTAASP